MTKAGLISFRLRKELDDDLATVLAGMPSQEVSAMCRTALRMAFGISEQKVMEFHVIPVKPVKKTFKERVQHESV